MRDDDATTSRRNKVTARWMMGGRKERAVAAARVG
jgi:hypothetical protein